MLQAVADSDWERRDYFLPQTKLPWKLNASVVTELESWGWGKACWHDKERLVLREGWRTEDHSSRSEAKGNTAQDMVQMVPSVLSCLLTSNG